MAKKFLPLLLVPFFLNACSVFMAATSSDELNMSNIRVGATRAQIEHELGRPISFYRQPVGDVATYQILTGDKGDYQRAAAYALLDGLTLGIAEFATFPTEALQGDQNIFEVIYGQNGRARSVRHSIKKAPAANPTEEFKEFKKKFNSNERDA